MTLTDEHTSVIQEILGVAKKTHHIVSHKPDYNELIRPFRVKALAIPASNILDDVNNLAPEKFFVWDVFRVSIQGFSAGSVAMYYNSAQDDEIANFTQAGSFFFNTGNVFVRDRGESLVFQATGLTGTAYVSMSGLSIHQSILGKYLMS